MDHLKADGVDNRFVLESEKGSTGVAFVMYYSNGDRKFIFHWDNTPAVEAKMPGVSELKLVTAEAGAAAGALNAAAFGPMEGDISPETIAQLIAQHR